MERFTHDSLQVMIFMTFTLIKNNFKTTFYLNLLRLNLNNFGITQ